MKKASGVWGLLIALVIASPAIAKHEAPAVPGEYLVKISNNSISALSAETLSEQLDAEVVDVLTDANTVVVRRPVVENQFSATSSLAMNSFVEYVEPNYIYTINAALPTPDDVDFGKLWGLVNVGQADPRGVVGIPDIDIDADKAWDITTGSRDVVVGVIDTGIYLEHEDLKANLWVNEAEKNGRAGVDDDNNGYIDDVHGWDFANNKPNGNDDHSHGSHVSGTIGGRANNGMGVAGINWNVRLMALKFLTASGSGSLANAVKAIDYAIKMKANFTSNSWGGGPFSQALYDAVKRAGDANQLFIAAAGNNGQDADTSPMYPAAYDLDNIVSVAAINNKGERASFSNYGLTTVDLGAPGVNVYSSVMYTTNGSVTKKYDTYNGTSMACPHVAGVAALVLAAAPNLTAMELKTRLLSTVKPLPSLAGKTVTGGLVNAYNAVTAP